MNFCFLPQIRSGINNLKSCLANQMKFLMISLLANADACKCKLKLRKKQIKKLNEKHGWNVPNSWRNNNKLSSKACPQCNLQGNSSSNNNGFNSSNNNLPKMVDNSRFHNLYHKINSLSIRLGYNNSNNNSSKCNICNLQMLSNKIHNLRT